MLCLEYHEKSHSCEKHGGGGGGGGAVNAKDGARERDSGFSRRGEERGPQNRRLEYPGEMLSDESCPRDSKRPQHFFGHGGKGSSQHSE